MGTILIDFIRFHFYLIAFNKGTVGTGDKGKDICISFMNLFENLGWNIKCFMDISIVIGTVLKMNKKSYMRNRPALGDCN